MFRLIHDSSAQTLVLLLLELEFHHKTANLAVESVIHTLEIIHRIVRVLLMELEHLLKISNPIVECVDQINRTPRFRN